MKISKTRVGRISVSKMSVPKNKIGKMVKKTMNGIGTGKMKKVPLKNPKRMPARPHGGDLVPKPKGFGPADIGLVPSKY